MNNRPVAMSHKERPVRVRGKRPILPTYIQAKMMRRLTEAARYMN